jgi:hypothetical protein
MNNAILKSIIAGMIIGAIIYFTGPVIFIFLFVVMTLKFIFTPFGMGSMMMMMNGMRHGGFGYTPFAEKIRNMSDEEYTVFQTKMKDRFHGRCFGHSGQNIEND